MERNSYLLALPPLLFLGALFVVPLVTVIQQSLSGPGGVLAEYVRALTDRSSVTVLLYTFRVAAVVTLVTLVLGYPVAFLVSRARGSRLNLLLALILIPFWTSTVIRTYAWLVLFQRRGILNDFLLDIGLIERPLRLVGSSLGMQIAMVHIMLPFMILPLLSTMRGIDSNYLRAGAVLGANPLRQFLWIYLPLSVPGITAGCTLVFITSLGFYITPAVLGGNSLMIAVLIEQQASRLLDWPFASALATILLAVTCLMFLIYERTMRYAGGGRAAGERARAGRAGASWAMSSRRWRWCW